MDRKLNLMSNASGGNTGYLEELGRQPTVRGRGMEAGEGEEGGVAGGPDTSSTVFLYAGGGVGGERGGGRCIWRLTHVVFYAC